MCYYILCIDICNIVSTDTYQSIVKNIAISIAKYQSIAISIVRYQNIAICIVVDFKGLFIIVIIVSY